MIDITNRLLGKNISEHMNIDLLNHYSTPGKLFKLINFFEDNEYNLKNYKLRDFLN